MFAPKKNYTIHRILHLNPLVLVSCGVWFSFGSGRGSHEPTNNCVSKTICDDSIFFSFLNMTDVQILFWLFSLLCCFFHLNFFQANSVSNVTAADSMCDEFAIDITV